MSDAILVLGVLLIIVNGATYNQFADIWDLISNPSTAAENIPNVRSNVYMLGGELLFVFILSFLAQSSDTVGTIGVTLIIALWVVWSMSHVQQINSFIQFTQGNVPGSSRSTQG